MIIHKLLLFSGLVLIALILPNCGKKKYVPKYDRTRSEPIIRDDTRDIMKFKK